MKIIIRKAVTSRAIAVVAVAVWACLWNDWIHPATSAPRMTSPWDCRRVPACGWETVVRPWARSRWRPTTESRLFAPFSPGRCRGSAGSSSRWDGDAGWTSAFAWRRGRWRRCPRCPAKTETIWIVTWWKKTRHSLDSAEQKPHYYHYYHYYYYCCSCCDDRYDDDRYDDDDGASLCCHCWYSWHLNSD